MMAAELSEIERLLASRIGLDPVSIGSPMILRAAQQRMKELGLLDITAYEHQVRQSEAELQALIEEVVVSESWFFRDERPFRWFREYVREHWLNDQLRSPLRVLSLPCAGGEEPYSIAMTVLDLGLPARRFQIDAVDVSAYRLAIARRGIYSANAFRGPDLSFQAQYFRKHPQGYELDPSIRATVHFIQASVLDPHLFEGSPPYDVLFCRNLMIYLGAAARLCVLAVIERLLKSEGLLFIGHADRLDLAGMESRFTAVGDAACFVYRPKTRSNTPPPRQALEPSWSIAETITPPGLSPDPVTAPGSPPITVDARTESVGNMTTPATQVNEPPLLDQAALLANQGRFDEAIAVCERHLRVKRFSPPAYYLLGMICQAAGNRQRAEDCFYKTIYIDPMHDEALLALALLAERRGDHSAAVSFRRRAERSVDTTRKRAN
jgi:chemotaxis protein methyltransferase WspC